MRTHRTPRLNFLVISTVAIAAVGVSGAQAQHESLASHVLARSSAAGGLCSMPSCGDGQLAVAIASANSRLVVHAMDPRPAMVAAARKAAQQAGLLGRRVFVEKQPSGRLPYADNSIDLIVGTDVSPRAMEAITWAEVLRVLRPRGKAIFGPVPSEQAKQVRAWPAELGKAMATVREDKLGTFAEITKPPLEGVDEWTHWYHDPDNNPVSTDTVIRAPYMIQWLGLPYHVTMPSATVAAAGRIFVATGHIAHHPREAATLNTVTARNAYNGQVLWTRKLPEGYLVHRSAFIAIGNVFYLMDGDGCLLLDAETGKEVGRITVPGLKGGWNWMAMKEGVLYVQAGDKVEPAVTKHVESGRDHWSWGELSKGYYRKPRIPWGFGKRLAAYDMKQKKTLWGHEEAKPIDSRGLGLRAGRLFFYAPECRIGCMDAATGKLLWVKDTPEVMDQIEKPGKGLVSTPGFRTSCMMLCTDKYLFFEAQTRQNVVALSAETGDFLWVRSKTRNDPTLLFLDGQLITSHDKQSTLALDPATGATVKNLGFRKVNCTRMTATPDSLFCRGEGLGRYDRKGGYYVIDGSARPGCNDGALPANGILQVGPWACDCNLSLLGTVGLCSAGDFKFGRVATEEERLEKGEGDILNVKPLEVTRLDWPTYRGNNQRGASSRASLAGKMVRAWRHVPKRPGASTAPVSAGGLLFFGRDDGSVVCLSMSTGEQVWEFITGGPILQPPTVWDGRVFVGSGDGWAYAIEAATGRLLWRFRAAPIERKIMVYGKLCSTWPVNSGVLVHNRVAYFAAGIIDRDGTHVYALDAKTGKIVWQNNATGHLDERMRKGVSVQGGMTIAHGKLWLAAGNQVSPAVFDLKTGEYVSYRKPFGRPTTLRGREIGVWMGTHIIHGGRLLYSQPGKVVSPAQYTFMPIEPGPKQLRPVMPIRRSSVPPAWNDQILVSLTDRYNQLVCWDNDLLLDAFEVRRAEERLRRKAMNRNPDPNQRRRKRWQLGPILDKLFRHTGKWGPVDRETMAMVVAANQVVTVSGPAPWQKTNRDRWTALGYDARTGKSLWWQGVPSPPMANGMLIDHTGKVVIVLQNGEVYCLAPGQSP